MASATARATFFFHHLHGSKPTKSHLPHPFPTSKTPILFPSHKPLVIVHRFAVSSVDVSKEDKPLARPEEDPSPDPLPTPEEQEPKLDPRRFEERFAVLNTGIYECRSCGFRYDEAVGDPSYPIPPGLQFAKLPDDWRCPTCGAAKSFFESKSVEIAGFAQNQQFGLGGNTLTAGQKAFLIYGSLLLAFVLFLSGYFLQ
ncbi:rubredoxin [Cocos nucifera]|uniref:Rubredoxin n=1 Tax=Cocos nucifera TaxID=13894 RepID=A0A8K0MVU3_COCNU|nr:rubredoxin [Cocos nucifera]